MHNKVFANIHKNLIFLFKHKIFNYVFVSLIIIYIALLTPNNVPTLFQSSTTKITALLIIVIIGCYNTQVALLLIITYLVILSNSNHSNMKETFLSSLLNEHMTNHDRVSSVIENFAEQLGDDDVEDNGTTAEDSTVDHPILPDNSEMYYTN
jgi:hypothetical protein